MPYVEVWVDDEPCDGTCSSSKEVEKLEMKIEEAERLLRGGYVDAALHALSGDPATSCRHPRDMEAAYESWKRGRLPGFTNYARPTSETPA